MIWVEGVVEPVCPPKKTDLFETIKKAEKSTSDFQLYLDVAMGRIARDDEAGKRNVGR